MPLFDYRADNTYFVGERDEIGQIVRWSEADFLGHRLESHDFLEFRHLDPTHFVVGKEKDFAPDMEFVLLAAEPTEVVFETNFELTGETAPTPAGDGEDLKVPTPDESAKPAKKRN